MKNAENIFHLAIPCADLSKAKHFYEKLGCEIAREYDNRITINFFGDQVVCQLDPSKIDQNPQMYPRHFGVNIKALEEYEEFLKKVKEEDLPFFKEPFIRFKDTPVEHRSFFLIDPSNNLLEFKYYKDSKMMY